MAGLETCHTAIETAMVHCDPDVILMKDKKTTKQVELGVDPREAPVTREVCRVPGGPLNDKGKGLAMHRLAVSVLAGVVAVLFAGVCADATPTEGTRQKICLNGVWDFTAAGTSDTEIPKDNWGTLRVPSSWFLYGPDNFAISKADSDALQAWFRRSFVVPADWTDGRRIKLLFLCLDRGYSVYVNGQLAASNETTRVCFDVDITALVKFGGKNELAVMTRKKAKALGGNPDKEGGILRSVYLVTEPPVNIEYSHTITSVTNRTLTVKTRVRNEDTVTREVTVRPVVLDNGREVLALPAKSATVPAGKSLEVITSTPWQDPVLWGFGRYGRPYLYHLRTTLKGAEVSDVQFDRFGFREFGTKGKQFVFNGKPFFIKGDLMGRAWPFLDNPSVITSFYQGMRSANINFQRLHCVHTNTFDSQYWYQVGDELGHLVEEQDMARLQAVLPDDPVNLDLWGSYVNYHFNHPSLVMWCPDNESIHPEAIPNAETIFPPWNRLVTYIRELDPTRIVDLHHGYSLFAGVQMGVFEKENFMTFNIHPYGNLVAAIGKKKKDLGFDDSVPTLVGEIFAQASKIPLDIVSDPAGGYAEQKARVEPWRTQIPRLAEYGVGGTVLCALHARGFAGFAGKDEVYFGPWSDRVMVRDETAPGKPIIGTRMGSAKVRWPSLSGEGTKAQFISPVVGHGGTAGGYGHNFNWFDTTRPMFHSAIADKVAGEVYGNIMGPEPPLGPERAPEVVVCFGIDGKPIEGAYVYLVPEDGQAPPSSAVATDADGTAWFHLWDTGTYHAVAWHDGQVSEAKFTIDARPTLTGKPGYDHITWVDLGGIDIEQRREELALPAEFTSDAVNRPDELLPHGSIEHSDPGGNLLWWIVAPTRETGIVKSGQYSAKIVGANAHAVGKIKLEAGRTYKVSGWIYKGGGNNYGIIGIKAGNYEWLLTLEGSQTVGQWQYVQKEYVADGSEFYFYCNNNNMGGQGVCYYDDLSIRALPKKDEETRAHTFLPGPFKPDADGFITHWLACGPFPNTEIETEQGVGYQGHRNDLLEAYGGEANITPRYGVEYEVTFPAEGPWLAGDDVIGWRDLHTGSMVLLEGIDLPSRGILARPATMVCAYVACTVESAEGRQVKLAIGSDDGYKVWLNSKLVGQLEDCRAVKVDQEVYPVELVKGKNRLLLKVFQAIGGWAFYARFLDSQDRPITDLTITLAGKETK